MEDKNIVLIGITGCGKTTIGNILAQKLKLPFYDVDLYIEKKQGKSIADIFIQGEPYFRKIESLALEEIVNKGGRKVISTGGGVVKIHKNMEFLKRNSIVVFLNRNIETIAGDIDVTNRPLLSKDLSKIYELYEQRLPLYKKHCDYEIKNKESIKETIDEILYILR
ncbi:MAG: shikimate kinase [Clostridiaceae bacterium]|nr:shikimate kinase [Clostridiaceae bacterium]